MVHLMINWYSICKVKLHSCSTKFWMPCPVLLFREDSGRGVVKAMQHLIKSVEMFLISVENIIYVHCYMLQQTNGSLVYLESLLSINHQIISRCLIQNKLCDKSCFKNDVPPDMANIDH